MGKINYDDESLGQWATELPILVSETEKKLQNLTLTALKDSQDSPKTTASIVVNYYIITMEFCSKLLQNTPIQNWDELLERLKNQ